MTNFNQDLIRVMLASWQPKTSRFTHPPIPTTQIWHLSMNNNASVEAVGPNTICQGAWGEKSLASKYIGSRQITSVLVLEPTGDCEVVLTPIDCDLGMPAEQGLSHLKKREHLRSPDFQKKSSSTQLE